MSIPAVDHDTAPDPLVEDIPGTSARLGGISRSQIYELIAQGELESVKIGKRRLVTVDSMRAYVDRLRQATS